MTQDLQLNIISATTTCLIQSTIYLSQDSKLFLLLVYTQQKVTLLERQLRIEEFSVALACKEESCLLVEPRGLLSGAGDEVSQICVRSPEITQC